MIIRKKHKIVASILFIFSAAIFFINFMWGNSFWVSFYLAFMTFMLIFLSFAAAWELHDFWNFRWYKIDIPDKEISIRPLKIPVKLIPQDDGKSGKKSAKNSDIDSELDYSVQGELISGKISDEYSDTIKKRPLVIFSHGFSDNMEKVRYLTVPLSIAGYDVISYNMRLPGKTRNPDKEIEYCEPMVDLGAVISYAIHVLKYPANTINLIGFSLGSIGSIYWGLKIRNINSVIALSSISKWDEILPDSPVVFKGKWWLWLRYMLKRIPINPPGLLNALLSPYYHIKNAIADEQDLLKSGNDTVSKVKTKTVKEKLYFIHSRIDKVIPISQFYENISVSGVSENHFFIMERGGHNLIRYETITLSVILRFLKDAARA